ncbi:MAG: sensor histidine kinase N-terminal domain-containing protein [Betaproteobacteria bacterium]|jgi:two-component system OmpR family sensor kinase|nr:sensor histidine kinase N-terminal domain-containing protein [Betaproteobacteria bacterium]
MTSLRQRLLVALLGALLLVGVLASAATYLSARSEINSLLDEELRQVALSLRDHAVLDLSRLTRGGADSRQRVVVQIWDPTGVALYLSNTGQPLPLVRTPGFVTLNHDGRDWRVYTATMGLQTIQVGQPIALRRELATAVALRILIPVLAALPLFGLLIWLLVGRGLAPVARLARTIASRSATSLAPLPADRLPEEVAPLVASLNGLLARLEQSFGLQRRFAADAAHELRTPLTALGLQIQLLERAKTDEERESAVGRLREGVKRATRLVEQLLVMARLEPDAADQPAERVELGALAYSVTRDFAPLAEARSVALEVDADENVATLGAEDALRILLSNLVDNAIRYTLPGGTIVVRVSMAAGDATLEVADDGPGIPESERARVFDRFYRVAGADQPGSGLGLAIVRQVADLHRARVELGAGLGGAGLSVRVRFPPA